MRAKVFKKILAVIVVAATVMIAPGLASACPRKFKNGDESKKMMGNENKNEMEMEIEKENNNDDKKTDQVLKFNLLFSKTSKTDDEKTEIASVVKNLTCSDFF